MQTRTWLLLHQTACPARACAQLQRPDEAPPSHAALQSEREESCELLGCDGLQMQLKMLGLLPDCHGVKKMYQD